MANNRLFLINRRLGVRVYLARFAANGPWWDVRPNALANLQQAFEADHERRWQDHGWELCDEAQLPDGLREHDVYGS